MNCTTTRKAMRWRIARIAFYNKKQHLRHEDAATIVERFFLAS